MAVERGFQGPKFEFKSQFVPLPLDFMQKQLESTQKRQDEGRTLQIDLLGKKIPVHQYDVAGIEQAKQLKAGVDNTLNELSNVDFNAPGNVQRLLKARQDVAGIHGQFGPAEHLAQRAATIDASIKGLEDKELELPSYVKDRKRSQIIQAAGSTPVGENIGTPGVTKHIDANTRINEGLKDSAIDAYYEESGIKLTKQDPEFWEKISKGSRHITKEKLLSSAYAKLNADHELQASVKQEADALSGGNQDSFAQLANDPFQRDEKGNVLKDKYGDAVLTNSILGNAFTGILNRAFADTKLSRDYLVNDAARRVAKRDEEDRDAGLIPLESTPTEILKQKNASLAKKMEKQTITSGTTAFASPTGLTSKTSDTKYDYPELTPEEQLTYTSIAKNFPGITNKDELNKKVKAVIEGISSVPVSGYLEGYKQKQKDSATGYLFGGNTVGTDGTGLSGNYVNRYIYDPETGKTIQGKDFQELLSGEPKGTKVQVVGKFNSKNPYTITTGNDAFATGEQVTVGNKTYVISGPAQLVDPKTGFDMNITHKNVNKINRSTFTPGMSQQVTLPGMGEGDYADVVYKDGAYSIKVPEYGISEIKESTPEKAYDSYLTAIRKLNETKP